ncbi:MAG: hypothetical protein HYS57_00570 [Parcubacteria group bacterium]|nr:hypothetical protein [Parcubacteria group bacterium]
MVGNTAMLPRKLTERERDKLRSETRLWNFWHPEARRIIPALIEPERVPRNADWLDALLAIYIAQAMLDDE